MTTLMPLVKQAAGNIIAMVLPDPVPKMVDALYKCLQDGLLLALEVGIRPL